MRVPASDLAARCNALYTAAIADTLDRRGLTAQTLPPELVPLREGTRLAGPAYPIKGRPALGADYDASLRKVLDMLGSVPAGHVSVYETGDREAAHLGELSVTALQARASPSSRASRRRRTRLSAGSCSATATSSSRSKACGWPVATGSWPIATGSSSSRP